jgi:hypothetical protein
MASTFILLRKSDEVQRKKSRLSAGFRAEDRARTGHPDLGKVVLYQMSYFRFFKELSKNLCPVLKLFIISK